MSESKTVKHFKDLGLDFVRGDTCNDGECDYTGCWYRTSRLFHDSKLTSVAWRENTGVRPKFAGDIEVMYRDGNVISTKNPDSLSWDDSLKISGRDVIKWRPVLNNEPEVKVEPVQAKPVYTKEMSDNGKLPSVGMEFMWSQWASEKLKLCTMIAISGHECWIELGDKSIIIGNITGCKPIDPRTTEEKAVDEIDKIITSANNQIIEKYRKDSAFKSESESLMEFIKRGKITGVSFKGEK